MRGLIGKTLFGACELILGRGGNGEKLKRSHRRFLHSHASDDFGNFRVQIVPIAQLQLDVKPIALCVRGRAPLFTPSCAPRTALVHRSVAAAEYITHPMM